MSNWFTRLFEAKSRVDEDQALVGRTCLAVQILRIGGEFCHLTGPDGPTRRVIVGRVTSITPKSVKIGGHWYRRCKANPTSPSFVGCVWIADILPEDES